jgi:predicted dehydrogenase
MNVNLAAARDPGRPLHVAVIGCGYWGRNYVRVFNALPGCRLTVVCDESLDRLQAIASEFPHIALCRSLDEVLEMPEVDAAVVCTPAATHFEVARRCVIAGLHVLVEKPMTTRSSDGRALGALAEERGLRLLVGHTFLYNDAVLKLREYVASADVGTVYYLYARRTSLGPIRNDVNAVWDLAPHDISIFNYVLDARPTWVSAVGSRVLSREQADVAFITLGYPSNIVGHVHVSWADPNKTREVVVVGSRKRIVFNDSDPLEPVRVFDKGVEPVPAEAPTFGEYALLLRDGDILSPRLQPTEPLRNQCAHFVDRIQDGGEFRSGADVGCSVVEVMEAIDASIAHDGQPTPVRSVAPAELSDALIGAIDVRE